MPAPVPTNDSTFLPGDSLHGSSTRRSRSGLDLYPLRCTLDDPAGQGVDAVRPIRDGIRARVEKLVGEPLPAGT